MAPDHSSAAPAPSRSVSPPGTSPGRRTHWALTALAGLGVVALAGGTFVLTYDDLRALALAGGAARNWAPLYPVLVDVLISVTVLSLVVARHARWWSRWPRWALLLAVAAGAAAASVQRAVKGYESLPDDALKAGVAIAPYLMLVLVVWLWLAMFRQIQRSPRPAPQPVDDPVNEPVSNPVDNAEPEEPADPRPALPAGRPDDPWLFGGAEGDQEPDEEEPHPHHFDSSQPGMPSYPPPAARPLPLDPPAQRPAPPLELDAPGPARRPAPPLHLDEPTPFPDSPPLYSPRPLDDDAPDWETLEPEAPQSPPSSREPVRGVEIDDDPPLPDRGSAPTSLPTDIELIRGENVPRPKVKPAATTRPDILMPSQEELAAAFVSDPDEDEENSGADRAEDPDGDTARADTEPSPPSGSFRSSPTPPQDDQPH